MLNTKSLRPQLMLIVALALAPLAIASIAQGIMHIRGPQAAIDNLLRQTSSYVTHNEQNIFLSNERLLQILAAQPELRGSKAECARMLSLASLGRLSTLNISLIGTDGKTICSSTGRADVDDYSRLSWWNAVKTAKGPVISHQLFSRAAGRNVLPVTLPLHDSSGAFTGALNAALDLRWVAQSTPYGRLPPHSAMLIIDGTGAIIASNRSMSRGLGADVARHGGDGRQHTFRGPDGTRWRWTAATIATSDKIIAFAIIEPMPYGVTRAYLAGNVLLPILIVILASLAMWLGTERLVIRWTNYLKRVSAAYKQNHFALELTELKEAPDEFRLLGDEMKSMAASIRERDRGLTAALEQKSAMAREIHHRIKNNLQIVSSVVSLYAQNITDRQAKIALSQIRARVGALTLIQRLMDMDETTATLDMRRLLTELADQMRASAAESNIRYRLVVSAESWLLPPDLATPVAFFAVEALAFEMFALGRNNDMREVALFFGGDGPDHLLLWVEDVHFTAEAMRMGRPPPDRVLTALAEQVKGEYRLEKNAEGKSRLKLRLPIRSDLQGGVVRPPDNVAANGLQDEGVPQPARSMLP